MTTHPDGISGLTPEALQEMANRLLQQRRPAVDRIPTRSAGPSTVLSTAQEALWLVEQLGLMGATYNEVTALRLQGNLNVQALRCSLAEVVQRHESLRTRFIASADGQATQVIEQQVAAAIPLVDLSTAGSTSQIIASVSEEIHKLAGQPFDLRAGPVFRVALLKIAEQDHVFCWIVHHIVWDRWSIGVFLSELGALYAKHVGLGPSIALAPLDIQYGDFARWERQRLLDRNLQTQLDYWTKHLAGAPALLDLPLDRPRPARGSRKGAVHHFALSPTLSAGVRELSRRSGATPFMTTLALYQLLLMRLSGQRDVVVLIPVSGRYRKQLEALIGFFVNMLPMRMQMHGAESFNQYLQRVKQMALNGYQHQDLPYARLVAQLRPQRELAFEPIAQVSFGYQEAVASAGRFADLHAQYFEVGYDRTIYDLMLTFQDSADSWKGELRYATDLFDPQTVARFAELFVELAQHAVADPDCAIDTTALARVPVTSAPAAVDDETELPYQAPQGEIEALLASIWAELLQVGPISRRDNFFDRGGHSLLAVKAIAKVRQALEIELPLDAFFECHDLEALARQTEMLLWAQRSAQMQQVAVDAQRERVVL